MNLGISIPMYNEEGNAERVISRMMNHLDSLNISFVLAVVNNGSKDATGVVLDQLKERDERVIPIHLEQNQGYGGGIQAGLKSLYAYKPEIIGWSWGDGQVCATSISSLYQQCIAGADLAKTYRIERQDGYRRRVISYLYAMGMRRMGARTPDINGCPKLFQWSFFEQLHLESRDWFLDAEAILKTEKLGGSVHNEPAIMEPRASGESKVGLWTLVEFAKNMAIWTFKRY